MINITKRLILIVLLSVSVFSLSSCFLWTTPEDPTIIEDFMDYQGYEGAYLLKLVQDESDGTFCVNLINGESGEIILSNIAAYNERDMFECVYMYCENGKKYVFTLNQKEPQLIEYKENNVGNYQMGFNKKEDFRDLIYEYSNKLKIQHDYQYIELDEKSPTISLLYNDILDCFYMEWYYSKNNISLLNNDVKDFVVTEDKIYLNTNIGIEGDIFFSTYDRATMGDMDCDNDYDLFKSGQLRFQNAREYWDTTTNKRSIRDRSL